MQIRMGMIDTQRMLRSRNVVAQHQIQLELIPSFSGADWVEEFLPGYSQVNKDTVMDIIHKEIGNVFMQVLEDSGVYKRNQL